MRPFAWREKLVGFGAALALVTGCLLPPANKDDGAGGSASTAANESGCSDGTREAYVDAATFPNIAGCSGGFQVPGVTTTASQTPQCDRMAGNDTDNLEGFGCSVADLCAEGWRVCESSDDLLASSTTGQCPGPEESEGTFWLTRQTQGTQDGCTAPSGNNLIGCGSFGTGTEDSCEPLTRFMRVEDCLDTSTWSCGNDSTSSSEGEDVKKTNVGEGGVLCCKILG